MSKSRLPLLERTAEAMLCSTWNTVPPDVDPWTRLRQGYGVARPVYAEPWTVDQCRTLNYNVFYS